MNAADVPPGPLCVDTDVFSWLAWGRDRHEEFADLIRGHLLALSFVSVAELRYGALKARWGSEKREALESAIRRYVILPGNDAAAYRWAEIWSQFEGQISGNKGVHDVWIAACALCQKPPLPVVTGNLSDFGSIARRFPLQIVHPDL